MSKNGALLHLKRKDKETGLHYNRFRYYDPHMARYISKDPIGLEGGINTSAYVADPTQWVDPLGLKDDYALIRQHSGKPPTNKDVVDSLDLLANGADGLAIGCLAACQPVSPIAALAGRGFGAAATLFDNSKSNTEKAIHLVLPSQVGNKATTLIKTSGANKYVQEAGGLIADKATGASIDKTAENIKQVRKTNEINNQYRKNYVQPIIPTDPWDFSPLSR